MDSQGSGNEQHRFRWWVNKKKGLVGNADTAISTPQVLKVNVNQTKSIAIDNAVSTTSSSSVPAASVVTKTEPIAKDKATSSMDKTKAALSEQVPLLQQAIKRLNTSIEGLYRIKGVLDNELNNIEIDPDWWEKTVNAPSLDIETMDSQIDEVSKLTDRLLSEQREAADDKQSQQGILPVTMSFLKTASDALSPATKVILTTVSQLSSSVCGSLDAG